MTDIPEPEPKILSLVEANAKLPQVIQVVEHLQQLQQAIGESRRHCKELTTKLAGGNGHSQTALKDQLSAVIARQDQVIAEMRSALLQLAELGALLKDLEVGLVDFYGQRAGEPILLCWKFGEEERIRFWHTLEGGFVGRQPVDTLIE